MYPPKHNHKEENVDNWLMSYADMITLLLAFFVLFLAALDPKSEKMAALTESMSGQFGSVSLATPFEGAYKALLAVVEEQQLLKDVAVERTNKGIMLEMATDTFFKANSTEFNPDRMDALEQIARRLKNIDFTGFSLVIEGHTSDEPPNSQYFTNWEFSAAQAAMLASYFSDQGVDARRIKVVGSGASEPLVPNLDAKGNPIPENRVRNRRIVINIED